MNIAKFFGALAIFTFASVMQAEARCPPLCQPMPRTLAFTIAPQGLSSPGATIDASLVPLEHSFVGVHYTLSAQVIGVVGVPAPVSGYVCAVNSEAEDCTQGASTNSFTALQDGSSVSGDVEWRVPAADEKVSVLVRFCQTQPVIAGGGMACKSVATASLSTPVSARYVIAIQDFTINHTRAIHNDTVALTLLGGIFGGGATPVNCSRTASVSCVQGVLQGDLNNGVYGAKGASIGPFTIVPGRSAGLRFGYALFNFGAGYGNSQYDSLSAQVSSLVSNELSHRVVSGSGPILIGEPDYTDKINGLSWNGCDGPLAVDLVGVFDDRTPVGTLDADNLRTQTNAIGKTVHRSPSYEFKSQAGCGESPRYALQCSITRTSWEATH